MEQPEFANYTDSQLETLRDDLARNHAKVLQRVSYIGIAFGIASVVALRFVPVEIFIVGPVIFVVVAFVLLAPAFRIGARRADVIRELDARGADVGTAISPVTGRIDRRAGTPPTRELDRAALRRLRFPGIGAAVLVVLVLALTAVIVITDAPDSSWLFTVVFIMFAALAVFFTWTIVVLASLGQFKRRLP